MAVGDVTQTILDDLKTMIEDSDEEDFDVDAPLLSFIKYAQLDVATLLDIRCLTEFETMVQYSLASGSGILLSNITGGASILKGAAGINYISVDGVYAERITDLRVLTMGDFYAGTEDIPKYWIWSNKLYFQVGTSWATKAIDFYYLKVPPDPYLTLDEGVTPSVDVLLNVSYHGILLDFAASKAFRARDNVRSEKHLNEGLAKIELANKSI